MLELHQNNLYHVTATGTISLEANEELYMALCEAINDAARKAGLPNEFYLEEIVSTLDFTVTAGYIRD